MSAGEAAPRRAAAPAVGLVLLAVTSLQVGAAFAVELFDELGPAGAAFGRLGFAALILVAIWRPRLRGHPAGDLRVAVAFGLALGAMNLCIYEAMDRIPLGVAVTFEFIGPLGVAVVGLAAGARRAVGRAGGGGIALLADYGGGSLDPLGVAFALAAGALWAAYIVLSQRTGALFPGGSGLAIAMVAGAVLVAPFGIAGAGAELLAPELLGADPRRRARLLRAALLARARGAAAAAAARVRRADVARAGGRRARGLVVLGQGLAARDWLAIGLVVVASAGASTLDRGESVESRGGSPYPRVPDFLRAVNAGSRCSGRSLSRCAAPPTCRSGAAQDIWRVGSRRRSTAVYVGVIYLVPGARSRCSMPRRSYGRWNPRPVVLWRDLRLLPRRSWS